MTNYTQWKSLVDLHEYSAIPDSVVLPESDDLTYFGGDTGNFDINSNEPRFNTEFSDLSVKSPTGTSTGIWSLSGLPNYPDVGDTHRVAMWIEDPSRDSVEVDFGNNLDSDRGDCYTVFMTEPNDTDSVRIRRFDSGSATDLVIESDVGLPSNEWVEVEILHASNGDITATFFDESGAEIISVSANDSTHITDGSYDNTGVGLRRSSQSDGQAWDYWRII